jgi:hypothetical protein
LSVLTGESNAALSEYFWAEFGKGISEWVLEYWGGCWRTSGTTVETSVVTATKGLGFGNILVPFGTNSSGVLVLLDWDPTLLLPRELL